MADTDYIIEILLEARDNASKKIADLRGEIEALKESARGESATSDLGKGLDDVSKKADKSTASQKTHTKAVEEGSKAAERRVQTGKKVVDVHQDEKKVLEDAKGAVDSHSSAHAKLDQQASALIGKLNRLNKEVENGKARASDASVKYRELGNDLHSVARGYETTSNEAVKYNQIADDVIKRSKLIQSGLGSPRSLQQAGWSELNKQISDLDARTARYEKTLSNADGLTRVHAKNVQSLAKDYETLASKINVGFPERDRLSQAGQSLRARANEILSDVNTREKISEVGNLNSRYAEFINLQKAGVLTESEVTRGLKSFRNEYQNAAKDVTAGTPVYRAFSGTLEDIDKKLKNVKYTATGGLFSNIQNKNVGGFFEALDAKVGDFHARLSGVASTLRGFVDVVKFAFAQPLLTGISSLAGSFVSVASAAAQAGAAIGGVFISGLAQIVPMASIATAALLRLRAIFQAVALNNEKEKQSYFEPFAGQIRTLQNQNQLVLANQQLVNSNIQIYDAQQRVRLSQIALTEARIDAIRNITNLMLAEKAAKLEAEGASLTLTESRRRELESVQKGASFTELAQSNLSVKQAELSKRKAEIEVPRAEYQSRVARKRGVEGSPTVISAQEGVKASELAVVQAKQAAQSAARQMRIIELELKQPASRETSTEAQLKFLMGQMSAPEKALTKVLTSMDKELRSPNSPLKKITDYFVTPFTEAATRLQSLLHDKGFIGVIDNLAKAMGASLKRYQSEFFGKRGTAFFEDMSKEATKNLPIITDAIIHIMHLFQDIAKAAAPAFTKLSEDWDKFWGKLDAKNSSPIGLLKLEQFFNKSAEYAERFAHLGHVLFDLFKAIGHDAAPQGLATINTFSESIERATNWVKSNGPSVTKFFKEAREGLSLIGGILFELAKQILQVFSLDSLRAFSSLLKSIVLPALRDLFNVLGFIIRKITEVVNAFAPLRVIGELFVGFIAVALGMAKIIGVVRSIMKAFEELKALITIIKGMDWASMLIGPWGILGGLIAAAGLAMVLFGEKQGRVKVSTEETNQALENQVQALRTIKNLNNEYKASGLSVAEAKTQVATSTQELHKLRKEGPAKGESRSEYDLRLQQAEQQVERAKLSYEERQKEFHELPEKQKETTNKSKREVSSDVEKFRERVSSLSGVVKEDRTTLANADPQYKPEIRKHLIKEERELEEAKEGLTNATKKQGEVTKQANELISQSTEKTSKVAPKLSEAYQEAYTKFGEAVSRGEVKAGEGMTKIRRLVSQALRHYGVSSTEIESASNSPTVIVHNKAGGPVEMPTYKPVYAAGGYIPARPGGHQAIVGEARHDEVILTTDPRHANRQRTLLNQYFQKAPHMAEGGMVYQSPFGKSFGVGRIDMGLDMTGKGPIGAIGNAILTRVSPQNSGTGWPGEGDGGRGNRGALIVYQLTDGPDKNRFTYLAENVDPAPGLRAGMTVRKGQEVAYARGKFPFLEAGWALNAMGTPVAAGSYTEGQETAAGKSFASFVTGLQHGVITGGELIKRIVAPIVKGGGDYGRIIQGALNKVTIAANIALTKREEKEGGGLGPIGPLSGGNIAAKIMNFFEGRGLSKAQAAGIVGNMQQESSLDPNAPGGGLIQGQGGRTSGGPLGSQLASIWRELMGPYSSVLGQLQRTNSPTVAARIFSEQFERPGIPALSNRERYAEEAFQHYAMGGLVFDHVRRIGLRHIRRKLMGFAQGGVVPDHTSKAMQDHAYHHFVEWATSKQGQKSTGFGVNPRLTPGNSWWPDVQEWSAMIRGWFHRGDDFPAYAEWGQSGKNEDWYGRWIHGKQYAQGGIAPWGGRPVPIIAHEGERVMNPGQYREAARLAGTSEHGLDHHMGFDSQSPRQHFASGGKVHSLTAPTISGFTNQVGFEGITDEEFSNLNVVTKIFKELRAAFKKLNKDKRNKDYLRVLEEFVSNFDQETTGILARLAEGREILKEKLSARAIRQGYQEEQIDIPGRQYKSRGGLVRIKPSVVKTGLVQLRAGGLPAIDAAQLKSLEEEGKRVSSEQAIVRTAVGKLASQIKSADRIKDSGKRNAKLKGLISAYDGLTKEQRNLENIMTQNIEARYQAQTQKIQDEMSKITGLYQVEQQKAQTKLSRVQAFGQFSEVKPIEENIKAEAESVKAQLEPLRDKAKKSGNYELQHQIEGEIANLEQTIGTTVVEIISSMQALIQQEASKYQGRSSELASRSKITAQLGGISNIRAAGELEKESLSVTQSGLTNQRGELERALSFANEKGDTAAIVTLTNELRKNTSELEENNLALRNSATVTRELVMSNIERESGFTKGIYGSALQAYEIIGRTTGHTNIKGMLEAAQGEKTSLGTERTGLEGEAGEIGLGKLQGMNAPELLNFMSSSEGQSLISAILAGQDEKEKEYTEKLVGALEQNALATDSNAQKIAELSGHLNQPQTWGTEAWKTMRSAFFSGMGNLLPAYSSMLPASAQPSEMPVYGSAEPGEAKSPTIGNLNITHPVEQFDPQLVGEQISYNISTTPAQ